LVALDETRELIPVPYAILERVPGEPLSRQHPAPEEATHVWRELGRDLALLHNGVSKDGPAGQLEQSDVHDDPRPWLEELAGKGLVAPAEAGWLRRWIDELEPLACSEPPRTFCHGDVNADNILVRSQALDYLAIVDWDGASWTDPAWDFVPVPLLVVPYMLEGYRGVAPVPGSETAEARIVWHHVQYSLFIWRHNHTVGRGKVEYGLRRLRLGIERMLELPGARWMRHLA
jgi:hypothetical protein